MPRIARAHTKQNVTAALIRRQAVEHHDLYIICYKPQVDKDGRRKNTLRMINLGFDLGQTIRLT